MSDQFERIQLGDLDPDATIWRYLTFPKFISLLLTQALWFSKLSILEDTFEGMTPALTRAEMKRQHRDMEEWFPDENLKQQVRQFVEVNEVDGRELIVPTVGSWTITNRKQCGMTTRETLRTSASEALHVYSLIHWPSRINIGG